MFAKGPLAAGLTQRSHKGIQTAQNRQKENREAVLWSAPTREVGITTNKSENFLARTRTGAPPSEKKDSSRSGKKSRKTGDQESISLSNDPLEGGRISAG